MLHTVEGAAYVLALLRFGPSVRVTVLADVSIGGDEETTGSGGRILDDVL